MSSAGKIIYELYYKPKGSINKILKKGLLKTIEIDRGAKEMAAAAKDLREIRQPSNDCFEVYFLTGKKYWHQTAFCLYSLQKYSGHNFKGYFVDDGTFDKDLCNTVKTAFPSSVIVDKDEIQRLLDTILPVRLFPNLRQRRLEYPHLRKLTDIHILHGGGAKLVMDSDMLFFNCPHALVEWLLGSDTLLFMKDCEQSYGYSETLMKELSGAPAIPEKLNVGVAGIPSDIVDWSLLERWVGKMLEKEGSSYLQEQALTAMLAANTKYTFLDEKLYKVQPTIESDTIPEILHHYVADSKYDYFVKGWRKVLS